MNKSMLKCWIVLLLLPHAALADVYEVVAARELAAAQTQSAWIYGVAIVIAGIAIGIGLYLGLKSRRR